MDQENCWNFLRKTCRFFSQTSKQTCRILVIWTRKLADFPREHQQNLPIFRWVSGETCRIFVCWGERFFPPNFVNICHSRVSVFWSDFLGGQKMNVLHYKTIFSWQAENWRSNSDSKTDARGDLLNFSLKWPPQWHAVTTFTTRCQTNADAHQFPVFSKRQLWSRPTRTRKTCFFIFQEILNQFKVF